MVCLSVCPSHPCMEKRTLNNDHILLNIFLYLLLQLLFLMMLNENSFNEFEHSFHNKLLICGNHTKFHGIPNDVVFSKMMTKRNETKPIGDSNKNAHYFLETNPKFHFFLPPCSVFLMLYCHSFPFAASAVFFHPLIVLHCKDFPLY